MTRTLLPIGELGTVTLRAYVGLLHVAIDTINLKSILIAVLEATA
jgi:hypothetical protein